MPIALGKNLRRIREERQLSVIQLANKLGTTRQHIYGVEAGKHGMTIERLQKAARILGVSIGALLTNNGH